MFAWVRLCLLPFLLLGSTEPEAPASPAVRFPSTVLTVEGAELDVKSLARESTLVVVTLKATWCPVCQRQLMRIKSRLGELEACGVRFLVLSPGPREELRGLKTRTGFPYPFVEDVELSIATRLGLKLRENEITPSIFILNPDLTIGWIQQGRNARFYGDPALLDAINCVDWI